MKTLSVCGLGREQTIKVMTFMRRFKPDAKSMELTRP